MLGCREKWVGESKNRGANLPLTTVRSARISPFDLPLQNGKFAVVGTYDGRCIFYTTHEQLKYYTMIHVRSTRGKNSQGRKVTGIEPMPGEDKVHVLYVFPHF